MPVRAAATFRNVHTQLLAGFVSLEVKVTFVLAAAPLDDEQWIHTVNACHRN
jgi:hypothetical protein